MKKILIIEDNEFNMKLFCDILEYQGYLVEKVFDGESGYNKIIENNYDLIILDIQLPKMSGFEILKKLKDKNIQTKNIVIVSAYAMDTDKQKASAYGVETYITKPIDINNFIKTIKTKLDEKI